MPRLLITCEHATNAVPTRWVHLFESPAAQMALQSHRGWDPGAASLALSLASPSPDLQSLPPDLRPLTSTLSPPPPPSRAALARDNPLAVPIPCLLGTSTRLLVELNRSPDHPQFWSEFSRELPPAEKEAIMRELYTPFRRAAREAVATLAAAREGPVFHLSVHTFAPELDGEVRDADVGLLYDPARPLEVRWADAWAEALAPLAPDWRVRHNYPYLGTDDGHTTHLRTLFSPDAYAGIELEINQALVTDADHWPDACSRLQRAFNASLATMA